MDFFWLIILQIVLFLIAIICFIVGGVFLSCTPNSVTTQAECDKNKKIGPWLIVVGFICLIIFGALFKLH